MKQRILITGGAGYIGAAISRKLLRAGFEVVIYDNLTTGFRESVPAGALFIQGDIRNYRLLSESLQNYRVSAVIHCAAKTSSGESIIDPYSFYDNNVSGSLIVATACRDSGVKHIVFTSDSFTPTKLIAEQIFKDGHKAYDLNYMALRFLNVSGAFVDGSHGPRGKFNSNLIKTASLVALCSKPFLQIQGTDYNTPDGSAIRDYMHIEDAAEIHVLALRHLLRGGQSETLSCGYGYGVSVFEVVKSMKRLSGHDFDLVCDHRVPGDQDMVIADPTQLCQILDWNPQFNDLDLICKTALEWEMRLMRLIPQNLDLVQDQRPV